MSFNRDKGYLEIPFPTGCLVKRKGDKITTGIIYDPEPDEAEFLPDHPALSKFRAIIVRTGEEEYFQTKLEAVDFILTA